MITTRARPDDRRISADELTDAILHVRSKWLEDGTVPDVRSIGCGMCYDFAEAVMEHLGASGYGDGQSVEASHSKLIDVVTEDWWTRILKDDGSDAGEAEHFHMDMPRLRREGAPLPDPDQVDDDRMAWFLGSRTHNWLVLDGRHYDATCPEGADHFLLMPFFSDQIAGWLSEERVAPAETA